MPPLWFVVRQGKEAGPYSGQQLKDLAASGRLQRTDLVRREDQTKAVPAQRISGLFASRDGEAHALPVAVPVRQPVPAAPHPATPRLPPSATAGPAPLWEHLGLILPLVVFCFPVGLVLVWRHPGWSKGQKWTWTGAVGAVLLVAMIASAIDRKAAQKDLAEADALWLSGKKADAAARYRALLQSPSVRPEEHPLIYGRLIDFSFESGNEQEGKGLIAEARKRSVVPSVSHTAARAALDATLRATAPGSLKEQLASIVQGNFGLTAEEVEAINSPGKDVNGINYSTYDALGNKNGLFTGPRASHKFIRFEIRDGVECVTLISEEFPRKVDENGATYDRREISFRDGETNAVHTHPVRITLLNKKMNWAVSTVVYYDTGEKAAYLYGFVGRRRLDERDRHRRATYWDKSGREIDQDTYCTARFGKSWRAEYAKEQADLDDMERRLEERRQKEKEAQNKPSRP